MVTVTIKVPDELSELIAQAGDRVPELLERSLGEPVLPAYAYRYVLDFIAGRRLSEEIAAFGPSSEMNAQNTYGTGIIWRHHACREGRA